MYAFKSHIQGCTYYAIRSSSNDDGVAKDKQRLVKMTYILLDCQSGIQLSVESNQAITLVLALVLLRFEIG